MGKKSRYAGYADAMKAVMEKKEAATSSPQSVLAELKRLKDQEFMMKLSIGGTDGK